MDGVELEWLGTLIAGLVCLSIGFLYNDAIPLPVVYVLMGVGAVLCFYGIFRASEGVR